MNFIVILIIVIFIYFIMTNRKNDEHFNTSIGLDMNSFPHRGRFNDKHLIGRTAVTSLGECRHMCNLMDTCKGISFREPAKYHTIDCRLYGNADPNDLVRDGRYMSW
jgi:hypothetical protein